MTTSALRYRWHAIEVRVTRRTLRGFLPSPGRITHLRVPSGPGIRDDSGAYEGWTVPTAYDPLVSKVIAWAPDRPGAIRRMVRALNEYDLRGISTTIGFCRDLIRSPAFGAAEFDTTYVDRLLAENDRTASNEQIENRRRPLRRCGRPRLALKATLRHHLGRRSPTSRLARLRAQSCRPTSRLTGRNLTDGIHTVNVDVTCTAVLAGRAEPA